MIEKIVVPDIGENVVSGKVVAVQIQPGDMVDVDDTVIELETDKAVVEIPSTVRGKVTEVLASEGDELNVGDVIAKVETRSRGNGEPQAAPAEDQTETEAGVEKETAEAEDEKALAEAEASRSPEPEPGKEAAEAAGRDEPAGRRKAPAAREPAGRPVPASPTIRRLARELGVRIDAVQGSGPGGRITKTDIKSHVRRQRQGVEAGPVPGGAAGVEPQLPDFSRWGEVESMELETVRRLTAESTTISWRTIPHVTQFDKADITVLEDFLKKNAGKVEQSGGKLTLTPVLTRVCAEALKKYPRFNTSLDFTNRRLIFKHYVHIGIAVDTPRGLLMPVVRNADTRRIAELAAEIADLAQRARNKKVTAAELEGGTFSISNQGGIGGMGFTPVILWPQVAILGVGRAAVEPQYVDGQIQARRMLPLTLSYDHRVVDGADAARFLRWICECLEQPMTLYL